MTGRERLQAILDREPVDRLAWTTLVDGRARAEMPTELREMSSLNFYRHVGCDILQFGNTGLTRESQANLARRVWPGDTAQSDRDGVQTRELVTPWHTFTSARRNGHPIEYPVKSPEDLRAYRRLWEETHYEAIPDAAASAQRLTDAVGDDGLYLPTLGPSPVQQLIEEDMGLACFYYLLQDEPAEMEALLAAMHDRRKQECEIVAGTADAAPGLIAVENTSSTLTSPDIYRRHSVPQLRDYADTCHRHGKKFVLHMCGLVRSLLGLFPATGMDAINATTPPTVGDCPFEDALDVLGDDAVLLGAILPPDEFHRAGVTKEELWALLDAIYTPRIRRAHLLLWLQVDGIPTPLWKFDAVREWMERSGGRE